MSNLTQVYALIVGIDNYNDRINVAGAIFPKLGGCKNDANDVLNHLRNDPDIQLKEKVLFDENASKPNIVDAIQTHLSQAKENDVAFFYYSGHGTCEHADTSIWTDQSNERLEAIVCHYDHNKPGKFLLTDKELRYLIKQLHDKTKAHIVTMFDCCHSGDNTRAAIEPNRFQERRVDFVFPKRQFQDFIFSDVLSESDFRNKSVSDVMPQGAHVQLSAAESDEPAIEERGHGVFTTNLLATLRNSNGNLSYQDLNNRIRNRMRTVFVQKPKLFAPEKFRKKLLQTGFLKKTVGSTTGGTLEFNKARGNSFWTLDRGELHGVKPGTTKISVKIAADRTVIGDVFSTELDHAQVKFSNTDFFALDQNSAYPVTIIGTQKEVVRLRLVPAKKQGQWDQLEQVFSALQTGDNGNFFAFDETNPDYDLQYVDDFIFLTKKNDPFRPLFEPVPANADGFKALETYLRHISNWAYLNNLANAGGLRESSLDIRFSKINSSGIETPIAPNGNQVTLDLEQKGNEWKGNLKIVVKNNSNDNIYLAVAYMSEDFSSTVGLLEPPTKMIEPGKSETVFEHNGGVIPASLDDKWYWYDWKGGNEKLKFLFSTSDFNPDALDISALPSPPLPQRGGNRGGLQMNKGAAPSGWASLDFQLVIPNPMQGKDAVQKKAALLEMAGELPYMTAIANGLYK